MHLPAWLNGVDNFADVIIGNANKILDALSFDDKAKLCELLPGEDKEILLADLLKGEGPVQFGMTPI